MQENEIIKARLLFDSINKVDVTQEFATQNSRRQIFSLRDHEDELRTIFGFNSLQSTRPLSVEEDLEEIRI